MAINVNWYNQKQSAVILDYSPILVWQEADDAQKILNALVLASPQPVSIVYLFPDNFSVPVGVMVRSIQTFRWFDAHTDLIKCIYFVNSPRLLHILGSSLEQTFKPPNPSKYVIAKHFNEVQLLLDGDSAR